jgi:hypothetical protein
VTVAGEEPDWTARSAAEKAIAHPSVSGFTDRPSEGRGREFESRWVRHINTINY